MSNHFDKCAECAGPVSDRNRTGLCRSCSHRKPNVAEQTASAPVGYAREVEAQQGSAELLTRLNEEFAMASRRAKVPFDDARLLLVNGVAI